MGKPYYFGAVGDVHRHMDDMVRLLSAVERELGIQLEFVLQVGDFEPHRNEQDLQTMAAPAKYRQLGDFHRYYQGQRSFPWPIFFIGGNHEPYGYLDQFPGGELLMRNCRYIGRSGCSAINGLNVAGLSGIYRSDRYSQPRPDISQIGSIKRKLFTYFNASDVEQLLGLGRVDILLLHEWPSNIIESKDQAEFEQARRSLGYDSVGNELSETVMYWFAPRLVLCGHMHKRYRRQLLSPKGQTITICCLASIHEGADSVAIFQVSEDGDIQEVGFQYTL